MCTSMGRLLPFSALSYSVPHHSPLYNAGVARLSLNNLVVLCCALLEGEALSIH